MSLDLDRYFHRVGAAAETVDLASLETLHAAHLAAIPFENVDVRLGRPIRLDLASLEEKLVHGQRGGYCFEQNSLFAAVLRSIGFEVATLEARVRPPGATAVLPRTHMVLEVRIDQRPWLADVGFGGDGPLGPVPMDGEISRQADAEYRVGVESNGIRVLERRAGDAWSDLYAFSPIPALPVDFEVANHFTSTHPASIFRRTLTVQRSTARERQILRGRTFLVRRAGDEHSREISPEDLGELLGSAFGLRLSPDDCAALEAVERGGGGASRAGAS